MGITTVPALIAHLRNKTGEVRRRAAEELETIGPAAVPALIAALSDESWDLCCAVREVLGKIGFAAEPVLIAALRDQSEDVRWGAADTLGKIIGPAAVPALIAALRDQNEDVRCGAADALEKIGLLASVDAVPALIAALYDESPGVRGSAAYALANLGAAVVSTLIAALRDESPHVRYDVAYALGNLGPAASDAVPALIVALSDVSHIDDLYQVRQAAADALERIGPPAACAAVPALIAALDDENWDRRNPSIRALKKIGPAAVPALIAALRDEPSTVRSAVAYVLGQIGPGTGDVVPALIDALTDHSDLLWTAWNATRIRVVLAVLVESSNMSPVRKESLGTECLAQVPLGRIEFGINAGRQNLSVQEPCCRVSSGLQQASGERPGVRRRIIESTVGGRIGMATVHNRVSDQQNLSRSQQLHRSVAD
jgi:HEAT repeat protein